MTDTMPKKAPAGDPERQRAAEIAVAEVKTGMKLGLGTGSTAEIFLDVLSPRVRGGLDLLCVPTSERTAQKARARLFHIPFRSWAGALTKPRKPRRLAIADSS